MTTGDFCLLLDPDIYEKIRSLAVALNVPLGVLLQEAMDGYLHVQESLRKDGE